MNNIYFHICAIICTFVPIFAGIKKRDMEYEVKITNNVGATKNIVINGNLPSEAEKIANEEFKNVGDDGLFPNHTDKDIWVAGFREAIIWVLKTR